MPGKKTFITIGLVIAVAVTAMAIQSKSKKGGKAEDAENKEKEKPVLHVEATEAKARNIQTYIESTATLKCNRQVDIMSKVMGQIENLMVEEGSAVVKGDVLLNLDTEDVELEREQAEIALRKSEREFKRAKKLFEQSLVTQEEFEMKKFDFEKSTSDLKISERKLNQMEIIAPFDGIITNRYCEIGQNISSADKLFMIAQVSTLKADVFLPEHQIDVIQKGQRVVLSRDNGFSENSAGEIERLSPVVDSATGTLKVTITLKPESDSWRPGSYVHLRIITGEFKDSLSLPRKALVYNNKQETSVFIIQQEEEKETVKLVKVETGPEETGYISITTGIQSGDRVVLTGKESLKDGDEITTSKDQVTTS